MARIFFVFFLYSPILLAADVFFDSFEWNGKPISVVTKEKHSISVTGLRNPEWVLRIPQLLDYNNYSYCAKSGNPRCTEPIKYTEELIKEMSGKHILSIPETLEGRYGLGTYFLIVRDSKNRFELIVSVRKSNTYTGFLSELLHVPFVYFPKLSMNGIHQTDERTGADCVALLVYGRRRMGYAQPYIAPPALYKYTKIVKQKVSLPIKEPLSIQEGNILHFGFQTAAVFMDTSPIGILNDGDMIIHTYHKAVELAEWPKIPYADNLFDILRWK